MRSLASMALPFALLAVPAHAGQEQGAGLVVTTRPGGATAIFGSPTEAQAACTGAGGYFGLEEGKFVCVDPDRPLESTRSEVAPPAEPDTPAGGDPAERGLEVESITLAPGESASFTLAEGFTHQLLRRTDPGDEGAITIRYHADAEGARLKAVNGTGYPVAFDLLADPDGNGGFSPMGRIELPGDGTPVVRDWPASLGTISVGGFEATAANE
ncbi:MAG: hypothetical protein ACFBQW_02400 [Sphingomonadaceae bacterium]